MKCIISIQYIKIAKIERFKIVKNLKSIKNIHLWSQVLKM